jgi:hypothetical protein
MGVYNVKRYGEVQPAAVNLLPVNVINKWAEGVASSLWGKSWVEQENAALAHKAEEDGVDPQVICCDEDGVKKALRDGLLILGFTILQCVGYRESWFDDLLYHEAHPKLDVKKESKAKKDKKKSEGKKGRVVKMEENQPNKKGEVKGEVKAEVKKEEDAELKFVTEDVEMDGVSGLVSTADGRRRSSRNSKGTVRYIEELQ